MIVISTRAALAAAAMIGSMGQAVEVEPSQYVSGRTIGFGNHPWTRSRNPMKGRPGAKLAKKAAKGTLGISHPR